MVPDLIRFHPVKRRELIARQHVIDSRGGVPLPGVAVNADHYFRFVGLRKVSAFRVFLEMELPYPSESLLFQLSE
jgi:hypothetical protein